MKSEKYEKKNTKKRKSVRKKIAPRPKCDASTTLMKELQTGDESTYVNIIRMKPYKFA